MPIASIQEVRNVRKHTNADALDLVDVLGWTVVVKRGEFTEGAACVYVEIDSVLPEKPEFEFLRNKHFRIKHIRLRGQDSNGICFPMSILPPKSPDIMPYWLGEDVSEVLGISHYEKPVPACLAGTVVGHRPSFIKKTDELNLRSYPHVLEAMKGLPYYITQKCDGSSGTYFLREGVFGVCSRNLQLQEDENNQFWKMARKYDIEATLRKYCGEYAIQAEVVGPGIQDNHLGLREAELRAFNLVDINAGSLFSLDITKKFLSDHLKIPMVPIIEEGGSLNYSIDELLSIANSQKYASNGKPAEGIVVRPQSYTEYHDENVAWNALSGKVLNENFED
jgi:RNA ligase (TIGR02306 family)